MEVAVKQACSNCGNLILPDGEFCLYCGDLLPATPNPGTGAIPALRHPEFLVEPTAPLEYAGFWLRVWAGAIDVVLEALVALLVTVVVDFVMRFTSPKFGLSPITARYATGIAFIFVLAIGAWLYCAFSESSRWHATLGKRVLGLQVLTSAGGQLSFGQATVRHFMKFLSLFTGTVGFMMAGWTKRRQALHDIPSDCIVVKVSEPSLSLFGKHA
jgi:uncharacterized RDD family membrane protein YckC